MSLLRNDTAHQGVACKDVTVASCTGKNGTIAIWDVNSCTQTENFTGHTATVTSLQILNGNRIVSGSADKTLKLWDQKTRTCIGTFEGHKKAVTSVFAIGDIIVSGSADNTVKLWDLSTGTCIETLKGHTDAVTSVFAVGNIIVSGSSDKTVKIWDQRTHTCTQTLEGHTNAVTTISGTDDIIVTGSKDLTVNVWCPYTLQSMVTLKAPDYVYNVCASGSKILVSVDHVFNVYNYRYMSDKKAMTVLMCIYRFASRFPNEMIQLIFEFLGFKYTGEHSFVIC